MRKIDAGQRFKVGAPAALGRMAGIDISVCRFAEVACRGQEAGVFSRAVVVELTGLHPPARQYPRCRIVHRPLHAAGERGLVKADARQPAGDRLDMVRLAIVGRAGKGQLTRGQAETVGGATFDQLDRLYRLDGGAGIDRRFDVATSGDKAALGINNGHAAAMKAFDHVAARDFDQYRVVHFSLTSSTGVRASPNENAPMSPQAECTSAFDIY